MQNPSNIYGCNFKAICPVNGEVDNYRCEIVVPKRRRILCEEIAAYLNAFEGQAEFQETLTSLIAQHFKAVVTLQCVHQATKVTAITQEDCSHHYEIEEFAAKLPKEKRP